MSLSLNTLAQKAIHPYAISTYDFQNIIFKKINAIRAKHGLNKLEKDKKLFSAAKLQTKYCIKENKLTHTQKNPKYKTVENRITSLGASNFSCGENIAKYSIGTVYHYTVDSIIQMWVNSPGHLKNITNPDYVWTGISVLNNTKGYLYITQVFASDGKGFKVDTNYVAPQLREKLPFKLKPYEPDYATIINIQKAGFISGGHKMASFNAPMAKKVFKGPYDGIVFELVLGSQVATTNENLYTTTFNRRNNNSSVNGRLYFPHYTKELMAKKNFRITEAEFKMDQNARLRKIQKQIRNTNRQISFQKRTLSRYKSSQDSLELLKVEKAKLWIEEYNKRLGLLKETETNVKREVWNPMIWEFNFMEDIIVSPENIAEVNILIFKNNQLIHPLYYHKVGYEADYMDELDKSVLAWNFEEPKVQVHNYYEKRKIKLNYDQSEHELNEKQLNYIHKYLNNFIINGVQVKIIASVEGTEEINRNLFEKRKRSLNKVLAPYLPKDTEPYYNYKENWAKFRLQIKEDSNFTFLGKLPQDSIREYLSASEENEPWKTYLKEQRLAILEIHGERIVTDTLSYLYKSQGNKTNYSLKLIQEYLIHQILHSNMSPSYIDRLPAYKKQSGYSDLVLNKYMLKYTLSLEETDYDYSNLLKRWRSEIFPKKATDTLLLTYFNLLTMYDSISPNVITNNIDVFNELARRGYYNKNMAVYALHAMPYYQQYIRTHRKAYSQSYYGYESYYSQLPRVIYRYYINDKEFNKKRGNYDNMIRYMCEHLQTGYANAFINQYFKRHNYDPDFRFIQLVITYIHPEIDSGIFAKEFLNELDKLGKDRWCEFFFGQYSPSFQILDDKAVWDTYCEKCHNQVP